MKRYRALIYRWWLRGRLKRVHLRTCAAQDSLGCGHTLAYEMFGGYREDYDKRNALYFRCRALDRLIQMKGYAPRWA